MVSEMTTGYGLLAPLMLTTAVAYLLVPRRVSLYENQVNQRTGFARRTKVSLSLTCWSGYPCERRYPGT